MGGGQRQRCGSGQVPRPAGPCLNSHGRVIPPDTAHTPKPLGLGLQAWTPGHYHRERLYNPRPMDYRPGELVAVLAGSHRSDRKPLEPLSEPVEPQPYL